MRIDRYGNMQQNVWRLSGFYIFQRMPYIHIYKSAFLAQRIFSILL